MSDAAAPTVVVTSKVQSATFYQNKVQLLRGAVVSYPSPCDEVQIIYPMPRNFVSESIHVQFNAALAAKAVLRGVVLDEVPTASLEKGDAGSTGDARENLVQASKEESEKLRVELKAAERALEETRIEKEGLEEEARVQKSLLDKMLKPSDPMMRSSKAIWDPAVWEAQLTQANTLARDSKAALRKLRRQEEHQQNEVNRLRGELSRYRGELESLAAALLTRVAVVTLKIREALPEADAAELYVSYMVEHVGSWSAAYDVHLNTEKEEVQLFYNGVVHLHAGEDLEKVRLTLSSAAPRQSGTQPTLDDPWRCGLIVPPPPEAKEMGKTSNAMRQRRSRGGAPMAFGAAAMMREEAVVDEADMGVECTAMAPAMRIQSANVDEASAGVVNFTVEQPMTIRANGEPVRVPIAVLTFPAAVAYVTVPSKQPAAFARATATNTSPYLLLHGEAAVFSDGDFINKSFLSRTGAGEEFHVDFGADRSLEVKRVLLDQTKNKERAAIFSRDSKAKHVTRYAYRTTIENKKRPGLLTSVGKGGKNKNTVTVTIRERIPMSNEEKLVVRLVSPAKLSTDKRRRALEADGEVEADVDIPPGEKVEFVFAYDVEAPVDQHIYGMEKRC